jgi:hypothetical protein
MFSRTKEKIKNDIFILRERVDRVEKELDKIQTNGVATAINKLNKEVFEKTKPTGDYYKLIWGKMWGETIPQEATLSAKVDAIIDHLKLEIKVEPERVTQTPVKVSAKKTKKGSK